jgi:biopolymer transport protein ExbB
MLTKLIEQSRMNRHARAVEGVWQAPTIERGADQLERGSPFRYIVEAGVRPCASTVACSRMSTSTSGSR